MRNDFILVIPARLESTRLSKKLLINIEGLSIIQRTYNCALKALQDKDKIIIATDSELIKSHCEEFGANVLKTSRDCSTGTKDSLQNYLKKLRQINISISKEMSQFSQLKI